MDVVLVDFRGKKKRIVNNVLKIPISRNLPPDKIFWVHNKNDYYSVKSGYYQACKIINRNSASSSSSSPDNGLWSRIWRISVQPKVRHFLWRVLHESLPCNVKLSQRLPAFSKLCPRCGCDDETQLHALKGCEIVRGLWLTSPLNLRVDKIECNNVGEWLSQMFTILKEADLKTCIFFEWEPPGPRDVKLNTDVAISIAGQFSVAGAVCRVADGSVIRWGVKRLEGITDVEQTEAQAVLFGLQVAVDIPRRLICEADSATVISRLQDPSKAIDPTQLIIDDCLDAVRDRDATFRHVRRQCNHVAHTLAKWGIFIGKDCIANRNIPFPVNKLINILV
ncbi:uncharacterized protein LOC126681974 [Mercurialis annua]|uniref:uncharacterized protein LOC126681974 n=1 Tax=Mercurialis annua TaxID=3986 RepID=UPI00215E7B9C|nr:uncharacterized protein LOC126681974 [Mercurialis annua]